MLPSYRAVDSLQFTLTGGRTMKKLFMNAVAVVLSLGVASLGYAQAPAPAATDKKMEEKKADTKMEKKADKAEKKKTEKAGKKATEKKADAAEKKAEAKEKKNPCAMKAEKAVKKPAEKKADAAEKK